MKKKKLHKIVSYQGKYNTFIETGWVENPTFHNDIYLMVNSRHKGGGGLWFYRTDEALILIEAMARTVNTKLTGIQLEQNMEGK